MPTTKELTIRTEDRPGTLAKVCQALAERKVNILAFQSVPTEGNSVVRFVVDNPGTAKKVLENQGLSYTSRTSTPAGRVGTGGFATWRSQH